MTTAARFKSVHTSETPFYRVQIHAALLDSTFPDGRVQVLVDECRESFELTAGCADGTRSRWVKFWTDKFAATVREGVRDVAA